MALRIRHLAAAKYRTVPWRNGGGVTSEIAVEPEGATVDSRFLWRLSLARIDRSGPFSAFDGYDRTIALITGAGMVLNFGERGSARVDKPMQPLAFSGEWAPGCALIACIRFASKSTIARAAKPKPMPNTAPLLYPRPPCISRQYRKSPLNRPAWSLASPCYLCGASLMAATSCKRPTRHAFRAPGG